MDNLFERAARVGLHQIRSWLPDGKQEGPEWVAKNPRRDDSSLGSFKINLNTGRWADFADGPEASGGDAVSLYAYIGGLKQSDAAREILTLHDPEYFPSKGDDFKSVTPVSDRWDGWFQQTKGTKNPPELDTSYTQKKHGEEVARWAFTRKGQVVMWVARFLKDGKKNDLPFTLWSKNGEFRWDNKGLQNVPIPLWNCDALAQRQTYPVLMFEGQKDAAKMEAILRDDYVVVGFYGGASRINQTDLEPLRGRDVWYCPDADDVGRQVVRTLKELDIKLHTIRAPLKCPKGWSLADEPLDRQGYLDYITKTVDDVTPLDDFWDMVPFVFLGTSESKIHVYSREHEVVFHDPWPGITKPHLLRWLHVNTWSDFYGKKSGAVDWDLILSEINDKVKNAPFFKASMVRTSGAWIDDGRIVISTGAEVMTEDKKYRLRDFKSEFVYVKSAYRGYSFDDPIGDCSVLSRVFGYLRFSRPSHAKILMGWILLAPFGGVLKWKPNVWLTGEAGSGKSWIFSNIVEKILGDIAIFPKGLTSTAAGIRSNLENSSIPLVMDEMESRDQTIAERHSQILTMFRESNSGLGSKAVTMHGSSGGGEGKQWIVNSMVLFGSIGAAIEDSADKSRFTVITLEDPRAMNKLKRDQNFRALETEAIGLTPAWVSGFHARTLRNIHQITKAIDIMVQVSIEHVRSRREADQLGTLLAGAWMVEHDAPPSASQAAVFVKEAMDEIGRDDTEYKSDQEVMIDAILTSDVRVDRFTVKIGRALKVWKNGGSTDEDYIDSEIKMDALKAALIDVGIKPTKTEVHIAINHTEISRMLAKTPWAKTYSQILPRLEYCVPDIKNGGRFGGVQKRYYVLDFNELLDDVPF